MAIAFTINAGTKVFVHIKGHHETEIESKILIKDVVFMAEDIILDPTGIIKTKTDTDFKRTLNRLGFFGFKFPVAKIFPTHIQYTSMYVDNKNVICI